MPKINGGKANHFSLSAGQFQFTGVRTLHKTPGKAAFWPVLIAFTGTNDQVECTTRGGTFYLVVRTTDVALDCDSAVPARVTIHTAITQFREGIEAASAGAGRQDVGLCTARRERRRLSASSLNWADTREAPVNCNLPCITEGNNEANLHILCNVKSAKRAVRQWAALN